ncbi:tRNA pseudouridine(55) synthase TruB [uncultured Duncaniella sp.]|jgi:tRNA pseudouridine55 synthase|uniref:tRNA pseudouridine(55) synthase TruB n=1 Tax=uncultured Duncaniella sp. TaxID=2768039 RepID=UPI002677447F|nr:tRNA pseudouridine(55) synthase TruB [uncultured Duncaniella sp.]MCI9171678.1 tRNA pseudouridine(55) synthase TruB [Muribaculaceae bacterium]
MDFITGETLYIDKPLEWTSFDVVKRVRGVLLHRLHRKKLKVGHAGTLDPLASGVMIVVTGRSTKLIESLQAGVKEYIATIKLGATTPSYDLETEIDATYPTAHITRELIDGALTRFVGRIEQVPPAFSACKVDGKRAYDMARKGKEVDLKPKVLVVDEIEVEEFNPDEMTLRLRIVCSKGTYIRALARDIGEALGSGGHLIGLRRTRVGEVSVDDCLSVDQVVELIRTTDITIPDDQES